VVLINNKNKLILILGLDAKSESIIQSTDHILVFDNGTIVEETHAQLISNHGFVKM